MSLFRAKPWYVAGLAFECQQCGRCCAGPEEGYVWISDSEIAQLASFLGQSEEQVIRQYTRSVGGRRTIIENPTTHDCIFLGAAGCQVYEVRPIQCRTWPFWESNLSSPSAWARANQRCVGINRGSLHPCEEIVAKRNVTGE